jgi:hypothetical protein
MNNPLVKILQEAREYYLNKPGKYEDLTPEQWKQLQEHITGKPSIEQEQEPSIRVSYPEPGHNYFTEFQKLFEEYSDDQLIEAFNGQVYNSGSGSARMSYLSAIRDAFNRRGYDYSAIGDEKSMSYMHLVKLVNRTIVKI